MFDWLLYLNSFDGLDSFGGFAVVQSVFVIVDIEFGAFDSLDLVLGHFNGDSPEGLGPPLVRCLFPVLYLHRHCAPAALPLPRNRAHVLELCKQTVGQRSKLQM